MIVIIKMWENKKQLSNIRDEYSNSHADKYYCFIIFSYLELWVGLTSFSI